VGTPAGRTVSSGRHEANSRVSFHHSVPPVPPVPQHNQNEMQCSSPSRSQHCVRLGAGMDTPETHMGKSPHVISPPPPSQPSPPTPRHPTPPHSWYMPQASASLEMQTLPSPRDRRAHRTPHYQAESLTRRGCGRHAVAPPSQLHNDSQPEKRRATLAGTPASGANPPLPSPAFRSQ
jgi:hypothetical protein